MSIKILRLTLILSLFSACITPERCSERFPSSFKRETVVIDTTIITSSTNFDTIIRIDSRDTVFILDKETDIKVKIVKLKGDSVYIKSSCPPDTIKIEKYRIETTTERVRNLIRDNGRVFFITLFLFLFTILVVSYFINTLKK